MSCHKYFCWDCGSKWKAMPNNDNLCGNEKCMDMEGISKILKNCATKQIKVGTN